MNMRGTCDLSHFHAALGKGRIGAELGRERRVYRVSTNGQKYEASRRTTRMIMRVRHWHPPGSPLPIEARAN
jgi:hypothetical protein